MVHHRMDAVRAHPRLGTGLASRVLSPSCWRPWQELWNQRDSAPSTQRMSASAGRVRRYPIVGSSVPPACNVWALTDGAAARGILPDTTAKKLGRLVRVVSTGVSNLSPEIVSLGRIEV